ncbi:MAG: VWA domain-containing protein [Phycisphaerales bacterium JB039]
MTFTHPWALLLLAIPVLLIVAPPARSFGLALPFDHHPHRRRRWLRWALGAFDRVPALVLAAALLMLAGPQMLKQPRQTRLLTNIQFAVDVSGSMAWENRYENAREAIEEFVRPREGDAFGLTLFGSHQIRWVPLTTDLNAILNALPFANPENQPIHMSGTRIGAALRFCRDNMTQEAERGDRLIILVSDGVSSDLGDGFAEADYAEELTDAQITLFHIHVGNDDIPQEVVDIATQTGGQAFAARDAASIRKVFQHIDRMRPAQFAPGGTVPMDHYWPFAVAALSALGLHLAGLLTLRHTPW